MTNQIDLMRIRHGEERCQEGEPCPFCNPTDYLEDLVHNAADLDEIKQELMRYPKLYSTVYNGPKPLPYHPGGAF